MKERMEACFARCAAAKRPALVVYVTCGCPNPVRSEQLTAELIEAGADLIELGVPFSDPMADGPVIQEAGQIALHEGMNLHKVLVMAKRLRHRFPETPLVLFSYFNVLLQFGLEELGPALRDAGIDAVLAVDLPLEERDELLSVCNRCGLSLIPLLSPATPPERAKRIAEGGSGFAYFITVRGVTGVRHSLPPELADELATVRRLLPLPVAAGFGISSPELAVEAGRHADAVVVGSAVMAPVVAGQPKQAVALVRAIARRLSVAVN